MEIKDILHYIQEVFAENASIHILDTAMPPLPLFARHGYKYYKAKIQDHEMILAANDAKSKFTPLRLEKELQLISNAFNQPVVYVFKELPIYQRNRLVELRVPFIVPNKQLYLPFMAMSLIERNDVTDLEREKLSPASQCMLLYHLEKQNLQGLNFQKIGERLNYSAMTVTRAAKELSHFDLIRIEGTKDRFMYFEREGRDLWEAAKDRLISPVKQEIYLNELPDLNLFYWAGDNALAHYSNLSPGEKQFFAVSQENYKQLKADQIFHAKDSNFEKRVAVQVWYYSPDLLGTGRVVDPLSLYLSMISSAKEDERVSISLDQLINNFKWLEG